MPHRSPDGYADRTPIASNQELGLLLIVQGLEQVRDGMLVLGGVIEPLRQLERRVRREEIERSDAA